MYMKNKFFMLALSLIMILIVVITYGGIKAEAYNNSDIYVECIKDYKANQEETINLARNKVNGITWDYEKGILTLENYDGGAIYISRGYSLNTILPDIEIRIKGKNVIHANTKAKHYRSGVFYIGDMNATFTGDGTLTVETAREGSEDDAYNLTVYGNLTLDGPTIILPKAYSALYVAAGGVTVNKQKKYIEGDLTVKSGRIQVDMIPIIRNYNGGNRVTYAWSSAVSVERNLRLSGGSVVVSLEWTNVASTWMTKPFGVFNVGTKENNGTIEAKDTTVVLNIDDKFSGVPTFLVFLRDELGLAEFDGDYGKPDPTKIKVDSSVVVYRGRLGDTFDFSRSEMSLSETSVTYDGKEKTPKVNVKGLIEGVDFTVEYKNNIDVGSAQAVVTGIGHFKGVKALDFNIIPKKDDGSRQEDSGNRPGDGGSDAQNTQSVFTAGKYKYKITGTASLGKNGTVSIVGLSKNSYKKNIKKIVIPATVKYGNSKYDVTSVGAKAFKGCKKAKTVVIKSKKIKKIGKQAFRGIKKKAKFKLPKMSKKNLKKLRKMIKKSK